MFCFVEFTSWSMNTESISDVIRDITELLRSHRCTEVFSQCFTDVHNSSYGTIFLGLKTYVYSGLHSSHVRWYVYSTWVAFFAGHERRELFKSYDGHIIMCLTDSFIYSMSRFSGRHLLLDGMNKPCWYLQHGFHLYIVCLFSCFVHCILLTTSLITGITFKSSVYVTFPCLLSSAFDYWEQ